MTAKLQIFFEILTKRHEKEVKKGKVFNCSAKNAYLCTQKLNDMYDQIREDTIFTILYAIATVLAALASIYLLFRRGNAFAADVTPPRRLRRWTAAFMAVCAVGHLWYIPAAVSDSSEAVMLSMLIGVLLDCMLAIPLALVVMLCMLQDRRRPLWPVGMMVTPLVVGLVVCIVTRSEALLPWLHGYFLLMAVGFTVYMVRAVRQYGQCGLRYTPIDTDAMNRLIDLGEMPDEPIVKANESMSGQFRPDNIVDLTVSYKWNKRRVSHTIAFEGLNILGVETCLFQRYDLAERRAIDHKEGISLPNFFYRLDF